MKTKKEYLFDLTVSGTANIDRDKMDIIGDVIANAPTLEGIVPITGVKANNVVEIFSATVETALQSGDCPSAGTASTVLAPRSVKAFRLSDIETLCQDKLDAVLPRVMTAGAKNEDLGTFQNIYMDLKVQSFAKELERGMWSGVEGGSNVNPNLNIYDGYLEIAANETGALGSYDTFSGVTPANAIDTVREMWSSRDEDTLELEGWTLNCGIADYYTIVTAIVNAFPSTPQTFQSIGVENELGHMESYFPGLALRIKASIGFGSTGDLFMTPNTSNLSYITDLEHDKESAKITYDEVTDKMHFALKMTFAPQYFSPKAVVYRKKV